MEVGRLAWALEGRWNRSCSVHHQNLVPCELNVNGPSSLVGLITEGAVGMALMASSENSAPPDCSLSCAIFSPFPHAQHSRPAPKKAEGRCRSSAHMGLAQGRGQELASGTKKQPLGWLP